MGFELAMWRVRIGWLLAATHAAAAVVAEVAVAGADGDRAAAVAGGSVRVEIGGLLAAGGAGAGVFGHDAGAGQQRGADFTVGVAVGMTIRVAVCVTVGLAIGLGLRLHRGRATS